MRLTPPALVLAPIVSCAAGAQAGEAAAVELRAPIEDAERTQVLVLGTEHLSTLGERFTPGLLDSLLDVLAAFEPDVIAVEALPPAEVDRLAKAAGSSEASAQILAAFAGDASHYGREAQAALGLTYEGAAAATEAMLREGAAPGDEARRSLCLHLLAAYDLPSALVQWSYLPVAARLPVAGVSPAVAEFLNRSVSGSNEITSIGVALARRLDLQTIASIDDHVDDEVGIATGMNEVLAEELAGTAAFQELAGSSYIREAGERLPAAAATGDLLALYQEINSPEHLSADVAAQWHLFYRTRLQSGLDRARAALWEARNQNIASRIRQASAFRAGDRVLVVIGAAHKPFLDQYLGLMMDVEVLQLAEVVKRAGRVPQGDVRDTHGATPER